MTFYFIYRFYDGHGRVPSWEDAMEHCSPEMQEVWREKLQHGKVEGY